MAAFLSLVIFLILLIVVGVVAARFPGTPKKITGSLTALSASTLSASAPALPRQAASS